MNFKKLSVIALAVASFAANAADLVSTTDMSIAHNKAGLLAAAVYGDYTATEPAPADNVGNNAVILQDNGVGGSVTGAIAYIIQDGNTTNVNSGNLAAVMQSDDYSLAVVYQKGFGNKAVIATMSATATTDANARDGMDVTNFDSYDKLAQLALDEIGAVDTSGLGLSVNSNVGLVTQTAADMLSNTAIIDITGSYNLAIVAQNAVTASNYAVITQVGTLNRAAIIQTN